MVTVGMTGAALVDAVTFGVVLAVLLVLRMPPAGEGDPDQRALRAEIADGLRIAFQDSILRSSLLLPVVSLLVPLLAHSRRWTATSADRSSAVTAWGFSWSR